MEESLGPQELICASDCVVVCGTVHLSWTHLVNDLTQLITWSCFDIPDWASMYRNHQLFAIANLRTSLSRGHTLTLAQLCELLKLRWCERPVDQIYDLVGLAHRFDPRFDPESLDINYDT